MLQDRSSGRRLFLYDLVTPERSVVARKETNRQRCQRLYPFLGMCEGALCTKDAVDRHHKDGDTANNDRSNIAFLCRSCHVRAHGYVARKLFDPKRKREHCLNCCRLAKPLRGGRCRACARYLTVRGVERPYADDGRREKGVECSRLCSRCSKPFSHCKATPSKGLCGSCYVVLRRDPDASVHKAPTHCSKGHPYTRMSSGRHYCRICHTQKAREWRGRSNGKER